MYPQGYIFLSERVHLRLAEDEKYIHILFISKYLYIYHWVLFPKIIICLLLIMSMNEHDNIFCHRKF